MKWIKSQSIVKVIALWVMISFLGTSIAVPDSSYAQNLSGIQSSVNPSIIPVMLKGIKVLPNEPLRFDFIFDPGNSKLENTELKQTCRFS